MLERTPVRHTVAEPHFEYSHVHRSPIIFAVLAYRCVDIILALMESGANLNVVFRHAGTLF